MSILFHFPPSPSFFSSSTVAPEIIPPPPRYISIFSELYQELNPNTKNKNRSSLFRLPFSYLKSMASRLPTQDPRSFRDPHHNMRARIVGIHTFEAGNVGNNPPSNSNAPTPSAARVTPVCVPLTVDSIPQPGQFYPDDGQGPIDVNSLLFRLRETLCRNTCGTVAGVPADDMTFVSTADGKGCLIAVAIPGLKQVYMYRSVGDPWDRQCWQSGGHHQHMCAEWS